MEDPQALNQRIEEYLLGHLDDAESASFEQAMQNDAELAKAVELHKMAIDGIAAHSRKKLRERLQEFHREVDSPTPVRRLPIRRWSIVAAVALLLIFSYYWWNIPRSSPATLYADYFQAYSLNLAQRNPNDLKLLQLEKLYQDKEYAAAIPLFDSLLYDAPGYSPLQLGAGISRMEAGQARLALPHFQNIIDRGDFLYRDQAQWYAALAHLQLDQTDQCRALLQTLAENPEADHHQEATRLLQDLDQLP